MSRTIDMEAPETWDEEDVRYLRDRGKLPADYEDTNAEEDATYEDMKKKELRGLVDERGLEVDSEASKADLVAALEEDDKSK